jgi:hypothetical protein
MKVDNLQPEVDMLRDENFSLKNMPPPEAVVEKVELTEEEKNELIEGRKQWLNMKRSN